MKKGQQRTGTVESVKFPNKATVRLDPLTEEERTEYCVIKGALPGQRVSLAVTKVRSGRGEGRLLEILEPSEQERANREEGCRHFGACGGCTYLSLPYAESLKIKEQQVHELLAPVLQKQAVPCEFEPIKPSPVCYGYRNKMEFSFGDERKDGPLTLGMHKKGSFYDIVTVDGCRIVDEDYRRILSGMLAFFAEKNFPFFHRLSHQGYLRHLLVRKASRTGEILVALVTTTQHTCDLRAWKEMLLSLPLVGAIAGILHIENDSVADVVKSDHTEILYGQDYFYEQLLGLKFKISTFSFFQTNTCSAEVLYRTAREYVGSLSDGEGRPGSIVYDLYSGTGTIAQLMAPVAKKVIGVEIVEEAVEAARENAALNGLDNCAFIAGDVLEVLDEIEEKPDFIILDPPRDGVHPKALKKIIDYGVERLVYISCKPTSLARDLEGFLEGGYVVERCVAVDQFPWTANIESIVLLSKLHTKQNIEVELEMSELDLTAAESKATYEEIKDYVLKQSGLKVSNLYIAQIKQKCGIIERVNYNQPKSENSRQPKCPPEKEAAIREALEYFRMI